MATTTNIILHGLSGKVGGLIFYQRGNKTCCRTMPKYKPGSMTTASKQCAREFGRASKTGKSLRKALMGILPIIHDSGMVNRLNKTLYSALREDTTHKRGQRTITPEALQTALTNFHFNNKAKTDLLPLAGTTRLANGHVQVTLPDNWIQALKHPRSVTHVQVQMAAVTIDAETGAARKTAMATQCIAQDTPFTGHTFELQLKGNNTVVIVMQLRFLWEKTDGRIVISDNITYNQAFVAAVLVPEKQKKGAHLPGKTIQPVPVKQQSREHISRNKMEVRIKARAPAIIQV